MKSFLFLPLCLILYSSLNAQTFYERYGRKVARFTIDSCTVDYLEPVREDYNFYLTPNPYFLSGPFTIDESGLFVSFRSEADGSLIVRQAEIDGYQPLIKNYGPYQLSEGDNYVNGCTAAGSGVFYLVTNQNIYYFNLIDSVIYPLPDYPSPSVGDLTYMNGFLYGHNYEQTPPYRSRILKIDPLDGTILDSLLVEPDGITPPQVVRDFTGSWKNDCSGRQLILPLIDLPWQPGSMISHYLGLMDLDVQPGQVELACVEEDILVTSNIRSTFDAFSWETHRQTCEIRLDLDADDSQGRAGPHYRHATYCETFFSLIDTDATLWTVDERSIDSVTVAIIGNEAAGSTGQYLRYPDDPQFSVQSTGDTVLTIYALNTALTYTDWLAYLAVLRLEVPEPQTSGLRTVETVIHAGGISSDGARSFIDVRTGIPSAGPDRAFEICRQVYYSEYTFLELSDPGGRWEPELTTYEGHTSYDFGFFQADSLAFGVYQYILQHPSCPTGDTAAINLQLHPALAQYKPKQYDTVQLCTAGSYLWRPGNSPIVNGGRFEPGSYSTSFADSFRILTEPGTYKGLLDFTQDINVFGRLCFERISLTLLPTPDSFLVRTLDTVICAGGSVALGGQAYDQTGLYEMLVPGQGCDTSYTLDLTVLDVPPAVGLDTAVCAGETISFGGREFSAFGGYAFSDTTNGCPTAYSLQLSPLPALPISSDTTLCAGAAIAFGDELLTQAGVYHYATANDGNCDTLYTLFLSYLPERLTVLDTFLVSGESLLIADTLLADPGTYDLHLTAADGCDSLLRVNVAGISTTITEAGKESDIRIRNPLRGIGEFQAFDSRGIPLPLRELEMFTIDGRRVGRWSGPGELPATALPAGVYVYRLRLVQGDGVVRGRVVVF